MFNDVQSEGGETDLTHFLVRLNLKTFDRTRKTLVGRKKPLIGQGKSWSDDEIWSKQRWKDVRSEGGKHN